MDAGLVEVDRSVSAIYVCAWYLLAYGTRHGISLEPPFALHWPFWVCAVIVLVVPASVLLCPLVVLQFLDRATITVTRSELVAKQGLLPFRRTVRLDSAIIKRIHMTREAVYTGVWGTDGEVFSHYSYWLAGVTGDGRQTFVTKLNKEQAQYVKLGMEHFLGIQDRVTGGDQYKPWQ